MSVRPVITVDGYAASGKSTLARELAKQLGYVHLSTGLLYRAVGWFALEQGVSLHDEASLVALIARHQLSLAVNETGASIVVVDERGRGEELASRQVSEAASIVARFPKVRQALFAAQREAFPGRGIVAEGRDMGTVIFPDARVKFFVNARLEVRAQRRFSQLSTNDPKELVAITQELARRDESDINRDTAPTVAAEGAVHIDNSDHPLNEVVSSMAAITRSRLAE